MGYTEMNMATKKAKEDVLVETVKETKKEIIKVKKVLPKKDSEKKVSTKKVVKEKDSTEEIQAGHESGVTVEQLFEAGAHFGHVAKKWNPKMKEYIWGEKNGIHIFDLGKTVTLIDKASEVLRKASADGKRIIIVGTKRQAKPLVEEMAKKAGIPYMTQRWLGGLLTNWKQIKQTIDRLNTLKLQREAGQLKKFTKKERVLFDKEIAKLERIVGGVAGLKEVPELVIVIDTHKEKLAVKEASSRGVMVIGLVDSNANPDQVDCVIPMNDDSTKALEIVIGEMEKAILVGRKEVKKQ